MDKATFERLSSLGYREIFRICREDPTLDSGSPDVQFLLALCVRDGRGVRKDPETFRKVLEWCMEKGSLLAIGYQAGYAQGLQEAEETRKETKPLTDGGYAPAEDGPGARRTPAEDGAGARRTPADGPKASKETEKPVTVLFLTRPAKKQTAKAPGDAPGAPGEGRNADGGWSGEAQNSSAYGSRVNAALERIYFVENEQMAGRKFSGDFSRIHQTLSSGDEAQIRSFWESGEYDGLLARMPEAERGEVLADLLININQFQKQDRHELISICRQMALRLLEGKVYISDLQLATKNEAGEKETLPVLWFAVWLGDLVLARYLLKSGANPNLVRRCRVAGGVTLSRYALGECILQGNMSMATLLLDNGANVRKMDGRMGEDGSESLTSPLAYAVLRNSVEGVCVLLAKGISPNEGYHYRDKEGKWHLQSALFLAVQHTKNPQIARLLLEAGANPDSAGPLTGVQGEMLKLLLKYIR